MKRSNTWVSWRLILSKVEMKEKIISGEPESYKTLCSRNLLKGINTWAVPIVKYLAPFLKWIREELKQMDQRTRKLMTVHKALHPKDDVNRLYVSRKEGG